MVSSLVNDLAVLFDSIAIKGCSTFTKLQDLCLTIRCNLISIQTTLNDSQYCYPTLIILFNIIHSFICSELNGFKHCYIIIIICVQLNGFESSRWLNSSIYPIDGTLIGTTNTTTRDQSSNWEWWHIPQAARLKFHYQMFLCHIQDACWKGECLTTLQSGN